MAKKSKSLLDEIQAGFFGDFLVAQRLIDDTQLREALQRQQTQPTRRIGEILVDLGFLDAEQMVRALQEFNAQIRVGELLISSGELKYMQLLEALDEQRKTGEPLGQVLIRLKFCLPYQVEEALERQTQLREQLAQKPAEA